MEWISYVNPTIRLVVKKAIDVDANDIAAAEADVLIGEESIGCGSLRNSRRDGLKLKYDVRIGKNNFSYKLGHLAVQDFSVDCSNRITD